MIIKTEKYMVAEGDANQWAIGVTKATFERIMKVECPRGHRADALALYLFYAYTSRWQNTSKVWATNSFAGKALGWSPRKVATIKWLLTELGLVENFPLTGKSGRFDKWLTKIRYVVGRIDQTGDVAFVTNDQYAKIPQVEKRPINTTNSQDKMLLNSHSSREKAEQIYDAYPRKVARPKALTAIKNALTKVAFVYLLNRTKEFAAARPDKNDRFTPHPATWFNQERYNDDPSTWTIGLEKKERRENIKVKVWTP